MFRSFGIERRSVFGVQEGCAGEHRHWQGEEDLQDDVLPRRIYSGQLQANYVEICEHLKVQQNAKDAFKQLVFFEQLRYCKKKLLPTKQLG